MAVAALSGWTTEQRNVVVAAYLGWTLDAFDFFLLVFVFPDIAKEFGTTVAGVAVASALTLAMRPLGAFLFGRLADRFGRRRALMADVLAYSLLGFISAFSPNLSVLLLLRALFGIAMGGEWGVGSSLTMETIPPKARGLVSGILQSGYPSGFLLASIAYYLLYDHVGWRGMLMAAVVPALLVFFIRWRVKESPAWSEGRTKRPAANPLPYARLAAYAVVLAAAFRFYPQMPVLTVACVAAVLGFTLWSALRDPALWIEAFAALAMLAIDYFTFAGGVIPLYMCAIYNVASILAGAFLKTHWRMGIFAVLLMTAFNSFSHGTQDLYPTFLRVQHGFGPLLVSTLTVVANIGAICGSLTFGILSERTGRRRAIVTAALLSLPVVPLWSMSEAPLWLGIGAFLMQFCVQSAWGIIPVHLNELSPARVRGTFPGFTYQLGNLLSSTLAPVQASLAESRGDNYTLALAVVAIAAATAVAVLAGFGREQKGVVLAAAPSE